MATSSTQVLNGIPGEVILHRRGLRQGDPLSPMLFILVMDILSHLVLRASNNGFLQPLASRPLKQWMSLYADDVEIFLRPTESDIAVILDILNLFGEASGLKTNVQKSNVIPIKCTSSDISTIQDHLSCELLEFPCKYLGLPLSLQQLTKEQVRPFIDQIAGHLPGWKADLLTKVGRRILVQFVLTSMLIYLAMAIDL